MLPSDADRRLTSEVRKAADALAAIVTSSRDAVIGKTVDGTITTWNHGATAVYGWSADEMVGQSFEVMVPPGALDAERARHTRAASGVAEASYRCVRLRSDGTRIDVVMSLSPIFDETGAITGAASISRPISTAERDEALFASLLQAAPDAIVCVDEDGAIVTVNVQVTEMFGYERDELLGADVEVLLPEELRNRHVGLRSAFSLDPKVRSMGIGLPLWGRRRDGSVFPIEVSLAPDLARTETIVIAVVRDMTEQRELERELVESEGMLRQLAESTDIVFFLRQIDPPNILYVSPSARSVLGHDPSEWMQGDRVLTVHPLDSERVEREAAAAVTGVATETEFRLVKSDGSIQWVRVVSTAVANPHGPPERTVVTIEDITERVAAAGALQRAESAAVEANQAKNLFLSRMSHELRTPLNAVLGFGQLLEMRLDEGDDAEAVRQILKGGRHLLDMINDVLDIARIDAGQTPISVEPVLVTGVLEEAVELMATTAATAGVELSATGSPADLMVLADLQRLRQILLNLLSNAIKYNRPGGAVWIDVEADQHQIAFTVHDDGPGIPAELQDRLFTPFDRLGAEASGVEGTGIGLALARSLAELMGGTLTFNSVADRGSAFTLALPRAEATPDTRADPPDAVGVTTPGPEAAPGSFTLLYVEDYEMNVHVVEHILKLRPEWRLLHAGLAGLGVELARAHLPDLMLVDLHLPDGSGEDVLRELKSDPATTDLPVVILTADATTGQSHRLLSLGAMSYMTKPLALAELLVLLDRMARPALAGDHG